MMKDGHSPLATPFASHNIPRTPGGSSNTHYFDSPQQMEYHGHSREITPRSAWGPTVSERPGRGLSIQDLPTEIISCILEMGYFLGIRNKLADNSFRLLATQISRRFREVVFHTPSLWSVIQLSPGNLDEMECLRLHLERSRDHSLNIDLSCLWTAETDFAMDQLIPHSKRWRQLSIIATNDHIFRKLQDAPAPLLEHLNITYFSHQRRIALPASLFRGIVPKLSRLFLRNVDIDQFNHPLDNLVSLEVRGYGVWPSRSRLAEMMSQCVSLQRLAFHIKPREVLEQVREHLVSNGDIASICLPSVRKVEIFTSEWLSEELSSFVRLFGCPNLQSLAIRDNSRELSKGLVTILDYSNRNPSALEDGSGPMGSGLCKVYYSNLYYAWSALPQSSIITTLELNMVLWPKHGQMRQMFRSMGQLRHLTMMNLEATDALRHIFGEGADPSIQAFTESSISIPSLTTLQIEFKRDLARSPDFCSPFHLVIFLRLFSLPSLASMTLKYVSLTKWHVLSSSFHQHVEEYPALTSLNLIDMLDLIPAEAHASCYVNPAEAFPHLQHLSLTRFGSNFFLRSLLPNPSSRLPSSDADSQSIVPWPDLRTLTISGDANVSKPLFHRALSAREAPGKRLQGAFLDDHFSTNLESWEWIREHVGTLERVEAPLF